MNTEQQIASCEETGIKKLEVLAYQYPNEVIENPGVQKRQKQPRWRALLGQARQTRAEHAIEAAVEIAEPSLLRRWLCDAIEEVFFAYELFFRNPRLRRALQVACEYADGQAGEEQLQQANIWAFDIAQKVQETLKERRPENQDKLHLHRKNALLEHSSMVAMAVKQATAPDALFSQKAPDSFELVHSLSGVVRILATHQLLSAKQTTYLRQSEYLQVSLDPVEESLWQHEAFVEGTRRKGSSGLSLVA